MPGRRLIWNRRDRDLPIPPLELREMVGPTDPAAFDNPSRAPILPGLPPEAYDSVLDFGCGCGRLARQLIQQRPRPRRYIGIDLHRGMAEWCERKLAPHADGFTFEHHDVYHASFNPDAPQSQQTQRLPVANDSVSLMIAWSVFTHLIEEQIAFYLRETARVLRPDGRLASTWFLFDKTDFPMMQDFQNCLYINTRDPTNAVIVDRQWLRQACRAEGLVIVAATPPEIRGFHWKITIRPQGSEDAEIELPLDGSPVGLARPPLVRPGAHVLGRDDQNEEKRRATGGESAAPRLAPSR